MAEINLTPVTDQKYPLRMWGMNLGMCEVTEKNWHEFFVRVRLYEELQGVPLLRREDKPFEITPELAKQHIGCHLGAKIEERDVWWLRIMNDRAKSLEFQVREFDETVEFPRSDDDI